MPDLREIKGVEIFAIGTWNGDSYTGEDLDMMVEAFSQTSDKIKPHVKLGHTEDQFLLRNDGFPAAGWISAVYRKGEKLLADIIDIPDKIFQLIEKGAYKKVSSEIYWDIEMNGKMFPRMLSAIAILGADMPAVTSLDDILAQYGIKDYDNIKSYTEKTDYTIKQYEFEKEARMPNKSEREIELETLLSAEQAKSADLASNLENVNTELSDVNTKVESLTETNNTIVEEVAQFKAEKEEAILDKEIAAIEDISPAMKPFIKAMLGETKKSYSVDKKEYNKIDLVKEVLKLHKSNVSVNVDNHSEKSNDEAKDEQAKLKEYAKANELDLSNSEDYRKAYKNYNK